MIMAGLEALVYPERTQKLPRSNFLVKFYNAVSKPKLRSNGYESRLYMGRAGDADDGRQSWT